MRQANRRDSTEREIVTALRKVGAQVLYGNVFDLLVLFRGRLFMLDAKTVKGQPTATQRALVLQGWPLEFVTDATAALKVIGAV
jgi:hypothetical protein